MSHNTALSLCTQQSLNLHMLTIVPINEKPTESTILLPRFIACEFHCTRLPPSLTHIPLTLSPLTFEVEVSRRFLHLRPSSLLNQPHALFEVICEDTHSNKVSVSENCACNNS